MSSPATPVAVPNTTTWLGRMFASIGSVFTHEVWPWFSALLSSIALDTIHKLQPDAIAAVEEIVTDIPLLLSQPGNFLKAFNAVVANLFQKAEAAGIQATDSDIMAAAHAALANKVASAS